MITTRPYHPTDEGIPRTHPTLINARFLPPTNKPHRLYAMRSGKYRAGPVQESSDKDWLRNL
jgi:hypothetical protein